MCGKVIFTVTGILYEPKNDDNPSNQNNPICSTAAAVFPGVFGLQAAGRRPMTKRPSGCKHYLLLSALFNRVFGPSCCDVV